MKEHRTKPLRVTTPHAIHSDTSDTKLGRRCGCEDADSDLFDMWQFDLVSTRNSGMPADDLYFCHFHRQRRQQQKQQQLLTISDVNYSDSTLQSTTATASPTTAQYQIVTADNIASFTASTAALAAFTKNDRLYSWFSCEFQSGVSARCHHTTCSREKENENENEPERERVRERETDADASSMLRVADATAGCRCRRPIHVTSDVEGKTWSQTPPQICRFCYAAWCSSRNPNPLVKHEKLLSLWLSSSSSSSSSSSTAISSSRIERFSSIFNLISDADTDDNWSLKMNRIKEAIGREKSTRSECSRGRQLWCHLKDVDGNTALLVSGRKLLKEGSYDKAVELAALLLAEGWDANASNNDNRTLLSYSVQYMDESIRLTTLLINYGAHVWPAVVGVGTELPLHEDSFHGGCGLAAYEINKHVDQDVLDVDRETDIDDKRNSVFACFLISIMKRLELNDRCFRTLYLLAEVMGERPELMRSHVMSTMFRHAKCYSILGPVFLQIKLAMSPYWTQPQTLKYLCKSAIRKSIFDVPGRFVTAENVCLLMLPTSLQSYIMLEN